MGITHLIIDGFLTAKCELAEFTNAKTKEGVYNPTPAFAQKLVDCDIDLVSEYFNAHSYNGPSKLAEALPWFSGHLHIIDGVAYIIDEAFEAYCSLSFYVPIRDANHLTELLSLFYRIAGFGFNVGFKAGEQNRARLIREAINP